MASLSAAFATLATSNSCWTWRSTVCCCTLCKPHSSHIRMSMCSTYPPQSNQYKSIISNIFQKFVDHLDRIFTLCCPYIRNSLWYWDLIKASLWMPHSCRKQQLKHLWKLLLGWCFSLLPLSSCNLHLWYCIAVLSAVLASKSIACLRRCLCQQVSKGIPDSKELHMHKQCSVPVILGYLRWYTCWKSAMLEASWVCIHSKQSHKER